MKVYCRKNTANPYTRHIVIPAPASFTEETLELSQAAALKGTLYREVASDPDATFYAGAVEMDAIEEIFDVAEVSGTLPTYELHPNLRPDPTFIFPTLVVIKDNQVYTSENTRNAGKPNGPTLVTEIDGNVVKRYRMTSRIPALGFVIDSWIDVFSNAATIAAGFGNIVQGKTIVLHTSPDLPDLGIQVDQVWLWWKSAVAVQDADTLGMSGPYALTPDQIAALGLPRTTPGPADAGIACEAAGSGTDWAFLLSAPRSEAQLADGQGYAPIMWTAIPSNDESQIVDVLADKSVYYGTDWQEDFGAFRTTGQSVLPAYTPATWLNYAGQSNQMWRARPLANNKSPNSGGEQADYGAASGHEIVKMGVTGYLRDSWLSTLDYMRAQHFRESDGSRVYAANHPQCRFWARRPHDQSQDKLGKTGQIIVDHRFERAHGLGQPDDAHLHLNRACAFLRVTGCPVHRELLLDELEATYGSLDRYDHGARAMGNVMIFLGQAYRAGLPFSERQKIIIEMHRRLDYINSIFVPSHEVQVIERIVDTLHLQDANGNAVPCWVVWMQARTVLGIAACAYAVGTDNTALRDNLLTCAKRLAETVVVHGSTYATSSPPNTLVVYNAVKLNDDRTAIPQAQYGQVGITSGQAVEVAWYVAAYRILSRIGSTFTDPDHINKLNAGLTIATARETTSKVNRQFLAVLP